MHPTLSTGLLRAKTLIKRFRVALATAALALAAFGVLGFFWLPGIIQKQAQTLLSNTLQRPVIIESVSVSPYQLKVTLHNLTIDPSLPMARVKAIAINLSSLSIAHRAPVIQELVIDQPQIFLGRDAKGRLSIADILETFAKAPPSAKPLRFAFYNAQLRNGTLTFQDQQSNATHTVSELSVGIPVVTNFANKEDIWIEPNISAKINGAPFALKGKTHLFGNTKEAFLDIQLDALPLAGLERYATMLTGAAINSGVVNTQLKLSFLQKPNAPSTTRLSGDVTIGQFTGSFKPQGTPWLLSAQNANVSVSGVDLAMPNTALESRVTKLEIAATGAGGSISLKDQSLPDVAPFALRDAQLSLENLDLSGKTPTALALKAGISPRGQIAINGTVQGIADPANTALDLNINASSVEVVAFQRFAQDLLHSAILTKGTASFQGSVKGKPLALNVKGDATLADFNLLDRANALEIARWKTVRMQALSIATKPLSVSLPSVEIDGLFSRLTILPDGRFNLAAIAESPPAPPSEPANITIGKITLANTSVLFNDQFTKPNFRASLTNLSGTVGELKAGTPGPIAIQGFVDRTAPLSIQGQMDPLAKDLFLDVSVQAKGIEMPPMSPYAIKYLAYPIEKGKLSLDLRYQVEKSKLKAQNKIFLDQLTLGEKVESPDALSVPVSLAIALLKNSRGEIDINLPISGSINDPEFKLGSILFKAFMNLIVKAATAPFTVLGSLFASSADISHIAFASGSSAIGQDMQPQLSAIAASLKDRPALKLDITGVANATADTEGAKRQSLNRQIRAEKLAMLASKGESAGRLRDVDVTAQEYPDFLERVYKKASFKKPRNFVGLTKSLPVAEMEKLLLEHTTVGESELLALADQRSRAVRNWLIAQDLPGERIFVLSSQLSLPGDTPPLGRASFTLR